ncbi:MAG TPA: hypothetical protein VK420_15335 [Longimicrobium sp.]|nr:hypothetical protein [Longimicrobium sp.]
MQTKLGAEVEVVALTVVAELALLERRPELGLLCQEAARQGRLTAAVVDAVLPGLSAAAHANLLRHCAYLGLCDDSGALTRLGRGCADDAEAPLPEQGAYTFWVARHPLLGVRPLHFRREEDPRDSDYQSFQSVPEWFRPRREEAWTSVVDETRFCVRELLGPNGQPARCRLTATTPWQLTWDVDLRSGANSWRINGVLEWREKDQVKRASFATRGESVPDLDGPRIFASWEPRWDPGRGYVAMDFDGRTGERERAFLRELSYRDVSIPRRGTYATAVVKGVPVGPSSHPQAQQWANALARARFLEEQGYLPASRLEELFQATVRQTPLEPYGVRLAPPEEHLRAFEAAKQERAYWRVAAAMDLAPDTLARASGATSREVA